MQHELIFNRSCLPIVHIKYSKKENVTDAGEKLILLSLIKIFPRFLYSKK